ncbi:hypothetical protein [Pseudonocardia asaccharolytica]|uniref:Uncharacterized protein n=1 Tax=Pseudonocardia asaccharolytica DSM 44247 = NBRC 16224 TaxID=1123024 RepID=A0A511CY51_9PSEU|nr:hypothetical protein [Pseudonocardia asaccharolytica]GEL17482.1 hypothetical protein PA7_13190 [Pseudonocardia asaccharolytica DSM 44247 = NBRC 16224]
MIRESDLGSVDREAPPPVLGVVRYSLSALCTLGILGAIAEVGAPSGQHAVPWIAAALLTAALVMLLLPARSRLLPIARLLGLVVVGLAAYGVVEHLIANPAPEGFDHEFSAYWASLSPLTRSWYGSGDSPLAPGMLGQAALLLLLATAGVDRGFPRLRRGLRRSARWAAATTIYRLGRAGAAGRGRTSAGRTGPARPGCGGPLRGDRLRRPIGVGGGDRGRA